MSYYDEGSTYKADKSVESKMSWPIYNLVLSFLSGKLDVPQGQPQYDVSMN